MDKLLAKNIEDIVNRINEDDESLLKLTKDIGKIYYCIHKYYPQTFEQIKVILAKFYSKHINNEDDYQLQINTAYSLPVMAMIFDHEAFNTAEVYLKYSEYESQLSLKQKTPSTGLESPTKGSTSDKKKFTFDLTKQKPTEPDTQFEVAK